MAEGRFRGDHGSGGRAGCPMFGGSAVQSPFLPLVSWSLCPWARIVGQDISPTLPCVNVSDYCMLEVVVGGAEWQPRFCQSVQGSCGYCLSLSPQ